MSTRWGGVVYLQSYCSDDLARLCGCALPVSSVELSTGPAVPAPGIVLLDAVEAFVPTKSPLFEVVLEPAAAVDTPTVGRRPGRSGSVFTSRLASISPTGRAVATAAPGAHAPTRTAPVGAVSARNEGDAADVALVILANSRRSPEGAHSGAGKEQASCAATPE